MPIDTDSDALWRHSEYQSGFERLLTSLSTRFINLPIDAIDEGIVEALAQIGRFTSVDRCFVYQLIDDSSHLGCMTHEWCAPGVPSIKHRMQSFALEPLQWAVDQLQSGNVIHIPDSRELPEEASTLRGLYEALGVRSAVYLPLSFKSHGLGMLGFSCMNHAKVWSEDSITLLRVVGEIVVNAVDRKNDYLQLRMTKERYKSVVEDQTDFIVRWAPDGRHTFVNDAVCRMLGRTADDLANATVFEFIHPEDVAAVRKKVASLTVDQPSTSDEHRVILPNGNLAWHTWSDRALFDNHGNIVEYQSVGRDITAQKLAREELNYRQRLENLILHITSRFINLSPGQLEHEIVDALRQVGEFIDGDRSYIYLFDETRTTATLKFEWVTAAAPKTPPELQTVANLERDWGMQLLERGEPMPISDLAELPPSALPLRDAMSAINVASLIIVPIHLHGHLIGCMGISSSRAGEHWTTDSTALLRLIGEVFANALERKSAEQALAASEERLSLTIDAVADGFYDWDISTGDLLVSENWLACRQLPLDGNNPRTIESWQTSIHSDDQVEVRDRLADHLNGRTSVFECEYRGQTANGSWRWFLNRGRVIVRDADGNPLRMVGVERDTTEEVLSRQRLRDADAHLAHLARVATMGEIVAGIAHEVNQPLHAAATFANAVTTALESNDEGSRERAITMVGKISSQINRAADIIRRLREFTRPQKIHMAWLDINGLVREMAEMLAYESKRKRIRIEFDTDEFLPNVFGDRVQLQQVVVNLLHNAFESIDPDSDESALVSIRTSLSEGCALLEVSDNGAGLAPETSLENLFDAFFTTKDEGMGMGLALCRTIVTSHHGKIWGKSNRQGGMTFSVLLPVEPEKLRE